MFTKRCVARYLGLGRQ